MNPQSSAPSTAPACLAQALSTTLEYVKQLHALVIQEQQVLAERRLEALESITTEKNKLLDAISTIDRHREHTFATEWAQLQQSKNNDPAALLWEQIKPLAQQAREINRLNALVITSQLQYHHQGLDVLLASTSAPSMYDPTGQHHTPRGPRSIGSA